MKSRISIIVPTLNEEKNIELLLFSIQEQTVPYFDLIVVDGGSRDKTISIAKNYGAKIVVEKGLMEFPSRNLGAKVANGEILLFTCADVIFPKDLLAKISRFFQDTELIALSGPDFPQDSLIAQIEYGLYNFARFVFCCLPRTHKRFSTSTNFLAVRKSYFERTWGFVPDMNSDGKMGSCLSELGKVKFSIKTPVFISSRRFHEMGFTKFNLHYLYVLENFFPFLSKTTLLKSVKAKSSTIHRKMRLNSK